MTATEPSSTSLSCPTCRAGNVMRCRMVFEQGTSNVSTTTTGVGGMAGSGGISPGVFASSSTGKQQTAFAKRCAPPVGAPVGGLVLVAAIAFFIGLAATGSNTVRYSCWAFGGLMVLAALAAANENRTKLSAQLAEYERKWACLTCGHTWEHTPPSTLVASSG